jgi:chromosome segregation ATPase
VTMPTPSTEERLAAAEAALGQLQAGLQDLGAQAVQLRDRHTLLEERMVAGLADLQRALDAVNARRPPVRRKLQELEDRLDVVAPPATETEAPAEPAASEEPTP